jgi:hypothetical protein
LFSSLSCRSRAFLSVQDIESTQDDNRLTQLEALLVTIRPREVLYCKVRCAAPSSSLLRSLTLGSQTMLSREALSLLRRTGTPTMTQRSADHFWTGDDAVGCIMNL